MDDIRTRAAADALRTNIEKLGFSRQMASAVVNGHRAPTLKNALDIEAKLGIPVRAWVYGDPIAEMWKIMTKEEVAA